MKVEKKTVPGKTFLARQRLDDPSGRRSGQRLHDELVAVQDLEGVLVVVDVRAPADEPEAAAAP